jgi:CHAD domain-containing protein
MKIGDQDQISTFASEVITRNITVLQKCMGGARRQNTIEVIHDLRVASRRARVALDVFRQILPAKKNRGWEKEIKGLTKAFGDARDLDVQLAFLQTFFNQNGELQNRPGRRRLTLRISQRRKRLENDLMNKLDDVAKKSFLQDILDELRGKALDNHQVFTPPSPLFELSFNTLNKRLDEFLFYEVYLPFPDRIKELHLMRIASKRLRYTLEIFAPLYADEMNKILEVMRDVQTGLGEIRDCDVWLKYLPRFLEKEKMRVSTYFGNPRPFQRLVPGIQLLIENRKMERERLYSSFISKWKIWRQDEIWSTFRQMIFNPVLVNPNLDDIKSNGETKNIAA